MSANDTKVALNTTVKAAGIVANLAISDEDRLRIIITNTNGSNTIVVRGKILGQLDDGDIITTITGDSKQVINISTYDYAIIECTSFGSTSDYVRIIASSFNEAGVSTAIGGTAGTTIQDAETITFTSNDNSVAIVTDNTTKTIDLSATGIGGISKYSQDFITSDWVLNGSNYELIISAVTYGSKVNPVIQTYENIAGDLIEVLPSIIKNVANDIILQVTQVPDNRYNGKVIIL